MVKGFSQFKLVLVKEPFKRRPATRGMAIGQLLPPKFLKTYVFGRYSKKLHHFAPPENISWLRPFSNVFGFAIEFRQKIG